MRAKSEYPTQHAGQHLPQGSDPIKNMIVFDYLNGAGESHYLFITASGTYAPLSAGLVVSGNGMYFNAQGEDVNWTNVDVFTVTATTSFYVGSSGTITLSAPGSAPTNGITIVGPTVINLTTVGNHFGINDHTNAQIFAVFEDGTSNIGNAIAGGIDGGAP